MGRIEAHNYQLHKVWFNHPVPRAPCIAIARYSMVKLNCTLYLAGH